MHTVEDCPWIMYMEIDEETGERFLRDEAPIDVKKAYNLHLQKMKNRIDNNERIAK